MTSGGLTESARFEVDQRIAQSEVAKALVLLLALHEDADTVDLRARMRDGFVQHVEVGYSAKGVNLGGFGA